MTLPVANLNSPIVEIKKDAKGLLKGYLLAPWNSFFQQFVEPAPSIADFSSTNPLTVNANGNVILTGAVTVNLTRGPVTINLNGERIIPVSVGDTVSWTGPATVQFLGN